MKQFSVRHDRRDVVHADEGQLVAPADGNAIEESGTRHRVVGKATLTGIESHVDVRLTSMCSFEGGLDYVRGQLTDLDQPLPRMPPLRGRAGLRF
jgi:hypothetical protein